MFWSPENFSDHWHFLFLWWCFYNLSKIFNISLILLRSRWSFFNTPIAFLRMTILGFEGAFLVGDLFWSRRLFEIKIEFFERSWYAFLFAGAFLPSWGTFEDQDRNHFLRPGSFFDLGCGGFLRISGRLFISLAHF